MHTMINTSPFLPMAADLFDIQNPKRILFIGISCGQQFFLKQVLNSPGLLIDFAATRTTPKYSSKN